MDNVGDRIRKIRTQVGLSIDALGRATELTSGYLGRLERNEHGYTNPSIGALKKIAAALGVKVSELIGESASL